MTAVHATDATRGILLSRGHQTACVDPLGATLRSYRVGDRDVVVPTPVGSTAPGMHGCILAPWPNRLQDGTFTFEGVTHRVPVNEPERHNANHGLVWNRPWKVLERSASTTCLQVDLPVEEFGFPLSFIATYGLDDEGLGVHVTVRNNGATSAPVGIGFHPWLSPGQAAVDDCSLQVPVDQWLECDDRLLPVRWTEVPERLQLSEPRRLAGVELDDGFRTPRPAGSDAGSRRARAALISPDGHAATVWSGPGLPCWQVCTGDFDELGELRRAGVAVEPMSCPANALVTGDHLRVLPPGGKFGVQWGLALSDVS